MTNKDLKKLTFEESINLFRSNKQMEVPLFIELLNNIFKHVGNSQIIKENIFLDKKYANNALVFNEDTNLTITIPLLDKLTEYDYVDVEKLGSGTITIQAEVGVTLNGTDNGSVILSDTTAGVRIRKIKNNDFKIVGNFV